MRKFNKKGFTIVELVIVIAVIAILAGVLIPTFSGIVTKAQESKVLQEGKNTYTEIYAADIEDGVINATIKGGTEGDLADGVITNGTNYVPANASVTYTTNNGKVTQFVFTKDNYKATYNGANWTTGAAN